MTGLEAAGCRDGSVGVAGVSGEMLTASSAKPLRSSFALATSSMSISGPVAVDKVTACGLPAADRTREVSASPTSSAMGTGVALPPPAASCIKTLRVWLPLASEATVDTDESSSSTGLWAETVDASRLKLSLTGDDGSKASPSRASTAEASLSASR
eukprot:scaffold26856_cov140-Isochrysis_galbana.AAC.3